MRIPSTPMGPEAANRIESGESSLYYIGKFRYADVFGDMLFTEFLFEYNTSLSGDTKMLQKEGYFEMDW